MNGSVWEKGLRGSELKKLKIQVQHWKIKINSMRNFLQEMNE